MAFSTPTGSTKGDIVYVYIYIYVVYIIYVYIMQQQLCGYVMCVECVYIYTQYIVLAFGLEVSLGICMLLLMSIT